ncbi:MAG TPA: class I poly(R)-hydroxyalkanoic acid synthase [Burkholderiales bacterium]|jgi:polyhydroxyalkanoate synthase|nr:class I poly(R)-hydroxyalkanoic acid synthase [Burkholderiales bacterium]
MGGVLRDPARFAALQASYAARQAQLWSAMLTGQKSDAPALVPEPGDRRFAAREWRENPYYDYLKQSYLLAVQHLTELAETADLDARSKERLRFAVRQWCDAMCPANFAATNPAVLRAALDSSGESMTRGLANLLADTHKGRISQSDESAFEVGRNLAVTPGDVVYENELIQLIQYAATTAEAGKRPLVMIPPAINKYYILDLQPANSFVRYAVEQGHTVFMVSWRNVGADQGHFRWDDYLEQGIFPAFRVAREITNSEKVNALGFCVGGTLLGAALAVLAQKKQDIVESVTLLATMLDFKAPGQVRVFIDAPTLAAREAAIGQGGILPGKDLAFAFNALRANDLIWSYVVNSYLLGSTPQPFDLLYWNADSTNLPGPMYCEYVRNTYLENRLCVPGAVENCGVPVDLSRVDRPTFILATREDHIVPWQAAYRTIGLFSGEMTFVLGESGHIAGVVNPPAAGKRGYWISEERPSDPEEWRARAKQEKGSWWPLWAQWLERFKGGARKAPGKTGSTQHQAIEPAPGRYVKQKAS